MYDSKSVVAETRIARRMIVVDAMLVTDSHVGISPLLGGRNGILILAEYGS